MMKRLLYCVGLCVLVSASAQAQTPPPTSLGALNAQVTSATAAAGTATVEVSGTFSGTVSFKGGRGVLLTAISCTSTAPSSTAVSSTTTTGVFQCDVRGLSQIQAIMSAYTSGSALIDIGLSTSGSGSGGGGTAGSVTINDPNTTTQKVAVNGSGQMSITCANCSGSGASAVDGSAFTQGTNSVAPSSVYFKTSYTALTSGQVGILRGFSDGSAFVMGSVASAASDAGNPIKVGAVFNSAQPTVTTGQRVDAQATSRGALIVASGVDAFNITNVSGTVSLPTGAATAAKQPALGTAGTASTDVITVQGIASATPLIMNATQIGGNSWSTAAAGVPKIGLTDGTANAITSTSNALDVNLKSGNAGISAADRASFTYGTTTFTPMGGVYNSTITALTSGQMGAAALTTNRGLHVALYDSTDTAITQTGGSLNVNMTNGSAVDGNSYALTAVAATTTANAAVTECAIVSAASTNATSCKGSAGNVYGYELYNTTTTVYYLRFYNTSTAPTCSSATGFIRSVPVPPASSAGQVGGAVSNFVEGVNYGTGVGFCLTGGSSSTDNTNAAVGIFGAIRYK